MTLYYDIIVIIADIVGVPTRHVLASDDLSTLILQ